MNTMKCHSLILNKISAIPMKCNSHSCSVPVNYHSYSYFYLYSCSEKVLRRYPTMSQETADLYATHMMSLASQARGVIRDLNPKVHICSTNIVEVTYKRTISRFY
jgi:hypothetical protein